MININLLLVIFTILVFVLYIYIRNPEYFYFVHELSFKHIAIFIVFVILLILLFTKISKPHSPLSNMPYKDAKLDDQDVKIDIYLYYSPHCRFSRDFYTNEWKRFVEYIRENWNHSVAVHELNCHDFPDKCKKISYYPTIVLKKYNKYYEYRGLRTLDNLLDFAQTHL